MAKKTKKNKVIIPEVVGMLPSEDDDSAEELAIEPDTFDLDIIDEEPAEEDSEPKESQNSVSRFDPLQLYLQEIKKLPVLTKDQEKQLALRYSKSKDIEAAKQLVQANLWLVVKIAKEYQNAAKNLLDLIQEGNMGLMEAVKNFDPFREVRLPSYAMWWIKAYIVRFLIANFRLVKIGTTQAQRKLFFNLRKEKAKLEQAGFFPAPKLLAEKLDVRESEIIEMEQRMSASDLSVHTPLNDDSDGDLLSVLPNQSFNAEELLAEKESANLIHNHFDEFKKLLNEKELAIFTERLLSEEKVTLQELSDRFSISKERIRQIEERLIQKLKTFLETKKDFLPI